MENFSCVASLTSRLKRACAASPFRAHPRPLGSCQAWKAVCEWAAAVKSLPCLAPRRKRTVALFRICAFSLPQDISACGVTGWKELGHRTNACSQACGTCEGPSVT